jgi:hypothetical protein
MIESALFKQEVINAPLAAPKAYSMIKNDRTAGSIPVWNVKTATTAVDTNNFAENVKTPQKTNENQAFGFADLLDMINPLQHIPIVSSVYRHFTGDTVKPPSKIIGGGLFGGPIGAVASLASTIFQSEMSNQPSEIATNNTALAKKTTPPEHALTLAMQNNEDSGLTRTMLSFADLSYLATEQPEELPLIKKINENN